MTAAIATTMTIAQLLAQHAAQLRPSFGDPAYCWYAGRKWKGTLAKFCNGWEGADSELRLNCIRFDPKPGQWLPHDPNALIFVGYDDPTMRWDATENAWECVADSD